MDLIYLYLYTRGFIYWVIYKSIYIKPHTYPTYTNSPPIMSVILEAIVVGLFIVLIGTISAATVGKLFKVDLPPACDDWNRAHTMEISLFATGVIAHLLFEYMGANSWYCRNGSACQKGV
jgi:hypothetical protein